MPLCENCGKEVGAAKFCRACGVATINGKRANIDETRLVDLGAYITDSYALERTRRWSLASLSANPKRLMLAGCAAVAIGLTAGALAGGVVPHLTNARTESAARAALPQRTAPQNATPPIVAAAAAVKPALTATPAAVRSPKIAARASATRATAAPRPVKAPALVAKAAPEPSAVAPTPTASPSTAATAPPTDAPAAALFASNAPAIVHGEGALSVWTSPACPQGEVNVAVQGYPGGCSLYEAATSGALASGAGVALIVPVVAGASPRNVLYGLLYVQASPSSPARFLGILPGDGSGHLVVRVSNGVLMERNGARTKYSTFDGRRVVRL